MASAARALFIVLFAVASCGYHADRPDAGGPGGPDGAAIDASRLDAGRPEGDAPSIDTLPPAIDATPALDTTPPAIDAPPPAVDAPPLPVSCERTGAMDCSPRVDMGGRCPDGPTAFGRDLNGAIDATIAAHPEWFDAVSYPVSSPLIIPPHVNDYMQEVTDRLAAVGLCASGPGEELAIKHDGECSEAWDIVANPDAATSLVRRHYVGNCFPAWF